MYFLISSSVCVDNADLHIDFNSWDAEKQLKSTFFPKTLECLPQMLCFVLLSLGAWCLESREPNFVAVNEMVMAAYHMNLRRSP